MGGYGDALREGFGDSGEESGIHRWGTTGWASGVGAGCRRVAVDAAAGREAVVGIGAACRIRRSTAGKALGGCGWREHGWIDIPLNPPHGSDVSHRGISVERRIAIYRCGVRMHCTHRGRDVLNLGLRKWRM